ncbi:hypothetical protein CDD81_6436 [Ophiocordyceps australis]|uniref:ABC-type Fe3+ transport system n=1 Tax=Ophiocordyceps australis TaxID=1399860 RepID=A0A2C5XBW7_9HYPO|nr:hypothetical protein CDD81_6436 [Ophiocordyceps australis]
MSFSLLAAALLLAPAVSADRLLGFNNAPLMETRSIDEIYQAALAEGGRVVLWHGGDEANQQDALKKAFEAKFPNMTLDVTVDLSKYHDARVDEQLASGNVTVDSVILQTVHDYPRWAQEGALLNYAPAGFDQVHDAFKESISAAYYGVEVFYWQSIWNTDKTDGAGFTTFADYLRPEFKDKLVLTYPNDDDAVLFAFDMIMQRNGTKFLDDLLAQNPRWVRGTATPLTLVGQQNNSYAATFTSAAGFKPEQQNINVTFPTDAMSVSWAQTGAIMAQAPHPEGAKLLHNYMLSTEFQESLGGWSVRRDVKDPEGVPDLWSSPNLNPTLFNQWMENRANVERLRFWFESRIGTAGGLNPIVDDI